MGQSDAAALYRRISSLRWQAPVLAVLLVVAHQLVEHTWLRYLPHWQHFLTQVLFYGIVGPFLAWWALTSLRRQVRETDVAERALKQTHERLRKANQRLSFLIRVNRRLAEADDEEALLETILALPEEVVPVVAVSLVRLDERQQPLPPLHRGNLQDEVMGAWMTHLADLQVGAGCAACQTRTAGTARPCPIFRAMPSAAGVQTVTCFPLSRGQRRYGMLNIYLQEGQSLTEDEQSLLQAMAREVTLALESHSLRARELAMLTRLQKTHWWDDLEEHLRGALQHTVQALQANGGAFFVDPLPSGAQRLPITTGDLPHDELAQVETLAQSSREGETPVVVPAAEREGLQGVGSLLAIPLQAEGRSVGALALWAAEDGAFSRRRVHLAAVVAAQVALLVENHRLSSQVEYQAALAERARLAREIHDGLAQTLGYLRLRTAHLIEVLQREEAQDVAAEVREVQQLLDAAYVDAREAIDGLQLAAAESDLGSWMRELVQDFEILSGVPVKVCPAPEVHLPQNVQAQLQRVVQEALSNVRKHAAAHAVQIGWEVKDGSWLTLHIEDDGCGFDTQIAGHRSHHGLRIMRERTALLAGELQITSHQGQGTCVTVRLPLPEGERR